jgi:hypothetical protein
MTQPHLFIARNDAQYILEPLAAALRTAGVGQKKAQKVLRIAARRALRLAAQDSNLPVSLAEKEAERVVAQLVPARNQAAS